MGVCSAWVRFPPYLNARFTISCPWRRVCVGAFTCTCSPGVVAWHGSTRTAESDRPRVKDPHEPGSLFKDSGSTWCDRRCDYAVAPQKEMLPRVHRLADSRPLSGDWICDEFCIEIRRESNPREANPHLLRSLTLTIRPTEYIRLVPKVPITCKRWGFAPRGFDSLRISMQNSSWITNYSG